MPLELGALHEGLAALCAHVDARPVRVEVLAHGRVVAEHLGAALVRAGDRPRHLVAGVALGLYPAKKGTIIFAFCTSSVFSNKLQQQTMTGQS